MNFFDLKRKEDKSIAKSKQRMASGAQDIDKLSSSPTNSSKDKSLSPLSTGLTEQEFGTLDNPFPSTLHANLYLLPHILVDEIQPSTIIGKFIYD